MSDADTWSEAELVRVARAACDATPDPCEGVVVAASTALLALLIIHDRGLPDGFRLIRRSDVIAVERLKYADFHAEVLRLRGAPRPVWPEVDLSSTAAALQSLRRAGEMLAVCFDGEPDANWVGVVTEIRDEADEFILRPILPGGRWAEEPDTWPISACRQIDFGGEYVRGYALYAAAHSEP